MRTNGRSTWKMSLLLWSVLAAVPTGAFAGGDVMQEMGATAADLAPAQQAFNPNPVMPNLQAGISSVASNVVGTLSVENFGSCGASSLYYTHESADGFRSFIENAGFVSNFVYRDSGVGTWQYHDWFFSNFDLWSSGGTDYGIDAVLTVFHSGHGNMDGAGVYSAPMGYNFDGLGCYARSDLMALGGNQIPYGDERGRYFFWDTCYSLRYSGGMNPMATWGGGRARGVRMIFGYETTSIDSPNYGSYFWEEWNKGKSFGMAFLDASWRIKTNQSPVVMAFGATGDEASNRRNNERLLNWGSVSNSVGAWMWYAASGVNGLTRTAATASPAQVRSYTLMAAGNGDRDVRSLADGLGLPSTAAIEARAYGIKVVRTSAVNLAVEPDGDFELTIARPPTESRMDPISSEELIKKAQDMVAGLGLADGHKLVVGSSVRELVENTGTETLVNQERVLEKTVTFDQVVDGMPFIDPDAGHLALSFDASTGELRGVRSTLKSLQRSDAPAARALSFPAARDRAQRSLRAPELQIMSGSEDIGLAVVDGKVRAVYSAEAQDPSQPSTRPQLVVIPLDN